MDSEEDERWNKLFSSIESLTSSVSELNKKPIATNKILEGFDGKIKEQDNRIFSIERKFVSFDDSQRAKFSCFLSRFYFRIVINCWSR